MNQKNLFTIIGAVLVLQGIVFFFIGDKIAAGSFPTLDETGKHATKTLLTVMACLFILLGLITYAVRENQSVLWAYCIGVGLLTLNTMKHLLIDHINVPTFAWILQLLILLACIYLWMQSRKAVTTRSVKV